jgi:anti-anti-sigma factor
LSATLAGADGTIVGTVTRHTEPAGSKSGHGDALVVVAVAGDVELDTASLLRTALTQAIDQHPRVCCDLSNAGYFGAAGANLLVRAHQHAVRIGHDFGVRGAHGFIDRVLRIVGLDEVVLDKP